MMRRRALRTRAGNSLRIRYEPLHIRPKRRFFAEFKGVESIGTGRTINCNDSSLYMIPCKVTNPSTFANRFSADEKVLDVGLHSRSPRETRMLEELLVLEIEDWRAKGFSGLFFDTPNHAIVSHVVSHLNGVVVKPPLLQRVNIMRGYAKDWLLHGYPRKYLFRPAKRVVVRF